MALRNLAFLSLALPLLFGSAVAQPQPVSLVADIPFSFTVNNTTLPAGKYEIQKVGEWEFVLISAKRDIEVVFFTELTESLELAKANELVFNVRGDKHFLSKIWIEDEEGGYYLPIAVNERALMKKGGVKTERVPAKKKM
jgi:hypothetical protein